MTYSQRGEDDLFVPLLPETGRYLSIGEYDGKTFSNVRLLAEKGWEGVCVEPAAHAFAAMASDPPPGAVLVNALLGKHRGLTPFHYCTDALSTTETKHARKWAKVTDFTPTWVASITLADLLEAFPGPYDFISVDTEGTTLQIVDALRERLDQLATRILVYEHDGATVMIEGFSEIHRTPENAILERQ